MNLQDAKEIEKQIDYHLATYDEAKLTGDNKAINDCVLVINSLLSQLQGDTINLRTDQTIQ